jgi:broad specificity phosphatase PhoE
MDVPLNRYGHEQAIDLAHALAGINITAIYSSDLSRARETADALAQTLGLTVHIDVRLREIHQGEWEGLLFTNIQEKYAEELQKRRDNPMSVAPPGGETALQVTERVLSAMREINQKHPGGTVAIVSHGFAIACLLAHYQKRPMEEIWDLVPENGAWREFRLTD